MLGATMQSITLSNEIWLALVPIILIELSLTLYGLYDWLKQRKSLENKYVWLALILFISTIGPILYFLLAPRESQDI